MAAPVNTPDRALRADAARNRDALLVAARALFAADGFDASVEAVAQAAGVAVGTVYRHFPTKEALGEAVIEQAFAELGDDAERALAAAEPGTALFAFVRHAGAIMARDRVLVAAARARPGLRDRVPVVQRLFDVTDRVIARARVAGAVRPGIRSDDVAALLAGVGEATDIERYLDVVCAGLASLSPSPF